MLEKEYVTGDTWLIPARIKKNSNNLDLSGASIKAVILNKTRSAAIIDTFEVLETIPASDWENGLIVIQISKEQTALVNSSSVILEVQIEQSGIPQTWPGKTLQVKVGYIQ